MLSNSNIRNAYGFLTLVKLVRLSILVVWITDAVPGAFTVMADDVAVSNGIATITDYGAFSENSTRYRQNFCDRYVKMLSTGSTNIDDISTALSGAEVQILFKAGKYSIYDKETGFDPDYPGIHVKMMDQIAERGGFTWRNSFGVWFEEEKGSRSFTEVLRWGTEKYDALIGTYTPSTERMKYGISFATGHFDGSLIFVRDVPPAKTEINWINWTEPFEPMVWAALIGVIIFSAFAYHLVETVGAKGRREQEKSVRVWLMDSLYLSFINFTGNFSYEPDTFGGRVFAFTFAFWAMLITAAYTANLASLLVGKIKPDLQIRDIQDVIERRLTVCVHKTSYSDYYLQEKYPQLIPYLVPVEKAKMYDALNQKECDVLVAYKKAFETALKQEDSNPKCTLKWEGKMIKYLEDSFVTKHDPGVFCTDLVGEVISYYMTEMKDDGTLEKLWEEHDAHFATEGHCGVSENGSEESGRRRLGTSTGKAAAAGGVKEEEEEDSNSLSLKDMAGTILFQVAGSTIAVVIAIISGFDRKTKTKRSLRRSESRARVAGDDNRNNDEDWHSATDGQIDTDETDKGNRSASVQRELRELNQRIDVLTDTLQLAMQDKLQ